MYPFIFISLILNLQTVQAATWCDLAPEYRLFCIENNPPGESRFGCSAVPANETCENALVREYQLCEEGIYGYLDAPIHNLNQRFLQIQEANENTKYFEIRSTLKNVPILLLIKPLQVPSEISVKQVEQMKYRVCLKIKGSV